MAADEIRCFCARAPLLALVRMRDGKPYVHIKCYKGNRLYVEVEVTYGVTRFRCRECLRWHEVSIVRDKAQVKVIEDEPNSHSGCGLERDARIVGRDA